MITNLPSVFVHVSANLIDTPLDLIPAVLRKMKLQGITFTQESLVHSKLDQCCQGQRRWRWTNSDATMGMWPVSEVLLNARITFQELLHHCANAMWAYPANTSRSFNAGLMLDHRLRRWPNIKTALDQCIMFAGIYTLGNDIPLRYTGWWMYMVLARIFWSSSHENRHRLHFG